MLVQKDRLNRLTPEQKTLLAERLFKQRAQSAPKAGAARAAIPVDPARCHEPFPLTDLQQAYWIGRNSIFQIGGVASHMYLELENIGLDLPRLNAGWQRVIERHGMLRTVVLPDGQQRILERVPPYRIQVIDLRDLAPSEARAQLEQLRYELSHQVLQTDQWPLFDFRAVRLDDRRTRLLLSFDALILDAWSMTLVLREWAHFYTKPDASMPALELSFRDYVLAQAASEATEGYQRAKGYWQNRLAALPQGPQLPLNKAASSLQRPRFARRIARLDSSIWSRLKARAAKAGITPPSLLMAAYAEVLTLWSNEARFTLSVPQFNRLPLHPQVNQVAGEFASFSLLEVDNSTPAPFETRAKRLQEQLWSDLNHSEFSGVRVLREWAQSRRGSAAPLVPVVFTSLARETRDEDDFGAVGYGILGQPVFAINQTSQVWLDNHVSEKAGELVCEWDSIDELFPDGLPQDMLDAYTHLLGLLAKDEFCWQATFAEIASCITPASQLITRDAVNSNQQPIPNRLAHQLFIDQVAQRPAQPAVINGSLSLSYSDLFARSNRLSHRLRQLGAIPNTLVAVVMEKGWEQVVAALGILTAGAAYLPIDPEAPEERLSSLLRDSGAICLLTQSRLDQKLKWPPGMTRLCVDADFSAWSDEPLDPLQSPGDLMYVLYTSGSTGVPKGVMISHRGVVNAIVQTNATFGIGPNDRVLALTALHHDMSVFDIFGILGAGGTIVIPQASSRRDPAHWSELITRHDITIWNSVPAMIEMFLEYATSQSSPQSDSLRLAFLGGDWIHVSLPNRLQAQLPNAKLVSVGGPTETTLWNIWYPVEQMDPNWKSIPYGRPIANTKYYVLNDVLEPCPTWVRGELYCAGVGLAKGYLGDEEKTRAKFLSHPHTGERLYRTGDLGRWLPDGNIEFIGRADLQVKIEGQRIELGEIESALKANPNVKAAVVSAVGEFQSRKRLVAYVVANPSFSKAGKFDTEALRACLLARLPAYMVPSSFVELDNLPLNANGKVNLLALPPPALDASPAPSHAPAKPENDVITRIADAVARVLKLPSIDPDADLVRLGANSIDMVRISNLLDKELGFRPRIEELFRLQSVRALAQAHANRAQQKATPEQSAQDSEPDIKAILAGYRVMLDPAERERFKNSRPGIRPNDPAKATIPFEKPALTPDLINQYRRRRSYRTFSLKPIPFQEFGKFLSSLSQIILDGKPKFLYATPGGLNPTQTYLHVKAGRVEGVPSGAYYYHPEEQRLVVLTPGVEIDRGVHMPFINQPIFDEAAFSIFLVAQLSAIGPSYGERSLHYVTLEAGIMAHQLEMSAPACGLGLCQIGIMEFEKIRHLFDLEKTHVMLHSILGGPILQDQLPVGEDAATQAQRLLQRIKALTREEVHHLLKANQNSRRELT